LFPSDAFSLVGDTLDDGLDDDEPVLATCEAELLVLWLPAELTEKPEPPCEPPELEPPPEECCASRVTETNRVVATARPESRIKHLPTD
jgi:hypothetical protein